MATPFPEAAVYGNLVEGNVISGNGLAGVTVHEHTPGIQLGGNRGPDNMIGVNNLMGDPDFAPNIDKVTTGIVVASVASLAITIAGNTFANDTDGVWPTGPVTITGLAGNTFLHVTTPDASG